MCIIYDFLMYADMLSDVEENFTEKEELRIPSPEPASPPQLFLDAKQSIDEPPMVPVDDLSEAQLKQMEEDWAFAAAHPHSPVANIRPYLRKYVLITEGDNRVPMTPKGSAFVLRESLDSAPGMLLVDRTTANI